MSESVGPALYALPVESRPAYSARIALDKLVIASQKAERTLAPSFWRKMLGGTSKDYSRSVIALLLNDTKAIRDTFLTIRQTSTARNMDGLTGTMTRLINVIDNWRKSALEYENATFGSGENLLFISQKMKILSESLSKETSIFKE